MGSLIPAHTDRHQGTGIPCGDISGPSAPALKMPRNGPTSTVSCEMARWFGSLISVIRHCVVVAASKRQPRVSRRENHVAGTIARILRLEGTEREGWRYAS